MQSRVDFLAPRDPSLPDVTTCTRCARLNHYCADIASTKRRAYLDQTYWGKPVSGFGDPRARLWILGLAPGAHGANRTGRVFTGDRSGEWLYRALHTWGFANQAESLGPGDGLVLKDAFVSCAVRCAPPDNRPTPEEFAQCAPYLLQEAHALSRVRVRIALGELALRSWERLFAHLGITPALTSVRSTRIPFHHGAEILLSDGTSLLLSYHPSQQNTFTGRLTLPMWDVIFQRARQILGD